LEEIIVITQTPIEEHLNHPATRTAFRSVKLLVGGYLAISVVTLAAIVLLRHHAAMVNSAVWIRGVIVVASAALMSMFVVRVARGSRRAYLRLRIVSAVMVAAIVVIIALPGTFPLWMKVEQGACGLVLIGVVAIVNGPRLRSLFAAR
jgi:hypothetical protein